MMKIILNLKNFSKNYEKQSCYLNKINCVIVGLGKMGLVYYNIIKNLNLNLVGVCDLKV